MFSSAPFFFNVDKMKLVINIIPIKISSLQLWLKPHLNAPFLAMGKKMTKDAANDGGYYLICPDI